MNGRWQWLAPQLALWCALVSASCAPPLRGSVAPARFGEGNPGWLALRDGDTKAANDSFADALAKDSSDARALFGAANLAYERGDVETALRHGLGLLESAATGKDQVALGLSPAIISRVSRLLTEVADRGPAEERLIGIDAARLPWQARYALTLVLIDVARKRGDAKLLRKVATGGGCVTAMELMGRGGRLPYQDLLDDSFTAEKDPRPLVSAGCQLQINTVDNRAGIRVLRAEVSLPEGRHAFVLDFAGPARLRVDGGQWYPHGGPLSYGPRWSATTVALAPGKHTVELRVGFYGGSADLALLVVPATESRQLPGEGSAGGDQAMMTFASALVANLVGDINELLSRIDKLSGEARFALGLAAAARLGQSDPTRPTDITRDRARILLSRALAVEPKLGRLWVDLSNLEMQKSRPREAAADAARAVETAPRWWPGHAALASALRAQGLDEPADRALEAGMNLLDGGKGGCSLIEQALSRAQDRDNEAAAAKLVERLARCDAQSDGPRLWLHKHGDLKAVKDWFDQNLLVTGEPLWLRSERADVLLGLGQTVVARDELGILARLAPRDTNVRVRLADALIATGATEEGRQLLAEILARFPGREDVRQAARLVGLGMPLDAYRLDGKAVIREYLAAGRQYQAPAVVVLDRAVEKVLPDGGRVLLTHSITQVLSKDAIEHVGEVPVPDGAEVLVLRTHKPDGTVREAEEIAGKSTISAPNLAVGDFVESETVEFKLPREAIAPGFIAERFYFQSFDAPLDRSEYVLIAPEWAHPDVGARAGAPAPVESQDQDGSRVLTFVAQEMPQVFAERSAVPAQEWIPSVRVSSGVSVEAWSRFIADGVARATRGSPELRKVAAEIASRVGADRSRLPEAIVSWVSQHIEPETDLAEAATSTLARGRGNRNALIVALARSLAVPADLVLARSLLTAKPNASVMPEDLDDFRDVIIRFPTPHGDRFVDAQLRRAPFAYLPPALDGALAIVAGDTRTLTLSSQVKDGRAVKLRAVLQSDGAANVNVTEKVTGWPAVEWTELLDRVGKDREKLRQEFEQRWLGQQFPGAQLDDLAVDTVKGGTQVTYAFKLPGMATRRGDLLRLRPSFFQSQPGRRFGTEPERKTTLMLGYDVPVDLDAEVVLPAGAKVIDLGRNGEVKVGGATFVEERTSSTPPDGLVRLVLRRQSRLPLMRIEPARYAEVAGKLRAVDPVEQSEIRIVVGGNE